jgi:hypothetical protein
MNTVPQMTEADALRLAKNDWLQANRGILKRVAGELDPPVAASVVSRVYRQKDRSARIEARLAEIGAPGFPLPTSGAGTNPKSSEVTCGTSIEGMG